MKCSRRGLFRILLQYFAGEIKGGIQREQEISVLKIESGTLRIRSRKVIPFCQTGEDRRGKEQERNSISVFGTAIEDRGIYADISGTASRLQNSSTLLINLTLVMQRLIPASVMPYWFCLCQPLSYLPTAALTFNACPVILIATSDLCTSLTCAYIIQ